jgi:hypothetical protein
MALLEHHPIHIRKKVALGITIGVGLILVVVMILIYTSKKKEPREPGGARTSFGRFYATILESTQSFFGSKDDTISK